MPDLAHWSVFLGAALILLITPGPSITYVVARGIAQGQRAAVLSSVGLALGDLLQVVATAIGISALLNSAPALFAILKIAGSFYLVSLGIAMLLNKSTRVVGEIRGSAAVAASSTRSLIVQGFLALNPKTALFFLAFLPQFSTPNGGPLGLQILVLGTAFVILGFITNSLFGCLGAGLVALVGDGVKLRTMTRYFGGGLLVVLGIVGALTPVHR